MNPAVQVAPHPQTGQLLLRFANAEPQHESILQRIARRVGDGTWITVFRLETTNILERLGYTPPKFIEHYKMRGKYTPYSHQVETTKFLIDTYRGWCLNGMRSGKTSATGWAIDALLQFGEAKRVLVLAPLSIMETSWARELFYINPSLSIYVANRSIAHLRKHCDASLPQVLVMNHDKISHLPNWVHEVFDPDVVVIDEATGFKAEDTDRYRALSLVMSKPRRLWLLTGTPCPQGPLDVWGLSRFVNPATPPSLAQWRQMTMVQGYGGKLIPLNDANEKVAELLYPAIRYRTEDCIEMPQQTYHDIAVTMTKEQQKAYREMVREFKTEHNGQAIVAVNAAVKMFKLLQIAAGIVLDSDSNPVVIGAEPRVKEALRLIEQAEGKAIIISPFTEVQKYIAKKIGKKYTCAIVNGSVTGRARTAIFDEFQNNPDGARVLVAHPEVIQFGLTLSAASLSIWWTGTFRTLHFIQANERMRGPDTHRTGVYMMEATALEREVYKKVQSNADMNDAVVDMYRSILDEPESQLL